MFQFLIIRAQKAFHYRENIKISIKLKKRVSCFFFKKRFEYIVIYAPFKLSNWKKDGKFVFYASNVIISSFNIINYRSSDISFEKTVFFSSFWYNRAEILFHTLYSNNVESILLLKSISTYKKHIWNHSCTWDDSNKDQTKNKK